MNQTKPHTPIAAGGSSFEHIDSKKLFAAIQLEPGMTFGDVVCGFGYYSLAALTYVGKKGVVSAIDLWRDGIAHLSNHIKAHHFLLDRYSGRSGFRIQKNPCEGFQPSQGL